MKVAAPLTSGLLERVAVGDPQHARCRGVISRHCKARHVGGKKSTSAGSSADWPHTAQTSSQRRAELPERQGYRTANECFHARDDRLKKSALGATSSQPKRRATLRGARRRSDAQHPLIRLQHSRCRNAEQMAIRPLIRFRRNAPMRHSRAGSSPSNLELNACRFRRGWPG